MVSHTFSLSTQDTEVDRPVSLRSVWYTEKVQGQPEINGEILCHKERKPCSISKVKWRHIKKTTLSKSCIRKRSGAHTPILTHKIKY